MDTYNLGKVDATRDAVRAAIVAKAKLITSHVGR
jgi:hypothetical protein